MWHLSVIFITASLPGPINDSIQGIIKMSLMKVVAINDSIQGIIKMSLMKVAPSISCKNFHNPQFQTLTSSS